MSLFRPNFISRFFRSRRIGAKSVSIAEFPSFFARARDEVDLDPGSGVSIDRPYAQSVWVYGAISLIACNVSRTPFRFFTPRGNEVKTGPQVDLSVRPNPSQNGRQFFEQLMTRLLLDGHVFIERSGFSGPRPSRLFVRSLSDFRADIRRDPSTGEDFAFRWIRRSNEEALIPGDELFEWKLDNPYHKVFGMSPLVAGWLAIYSDVATGVFNRSFFENGAVPGVIFSTDNEAFTQDQAEQAQRWWDSKRAGAKNAHRSAFMGNGLKPFNVATSHSDMEFPTLKVLSKSEILAIYHVSETLLGAQSPQTGVTIGGTDRKSDSENFYLNVVMPWAEQVAMFWNAVVDVPFGSTRGRFDFKGVPILQDRQLDRAKEGREWIKAGVPLNEVVRVFGLDFDSQKHGDEFWVPSNMLPASLLLNGPLPVEMTKRPGEVGVNRDDGQGGD